LLLAGTRHAGRERQTDPVCLLHPPNDPLRDTVATADLGDLLEKAVRHRSANELRDTFADPYLERTLQPEAGPDDPTDERGDADGDDELHEGTLDHTHSGEQLADSLAVINNLDRSADRGHRFFVRVDFEGVAHRRQEIGNGDGVILDVGPVRV
jgi:hypothetical protein